MEETKQTIAGISLAGGRKENYYFSLLEYFPAKKRWFLKSLELVREDQSNYHNKAVTDWIDEHSVIELIVNFPLTKPTCQRCQLECPGATNCHHPEVVQTRKLMDNLLSEDERLININPKKYEQERIEDNKVHFTRNILNQETTQHILSKPFKRKLKRGFIPYWNRPIDFLIWRKYYDQLHNLFNLSYDSFGNISLMLINTMEYFTRHFPIGLKLHESDVNIVLIELYRQNIISLKNIKELQSIDLNTLARVQIVRSIERNLNIFIYAKDLELISKNQKAFESFLLSLAGKNFLEGKVFEYQSEDKFIFPDFS